jgi:putative lipoic acid-binding regulatory protein
MDKSWLISFREKLDQHYAWPSLYIFKFIVPTGREVEVKKLFPNHDTTEKLSKQGNYTSITVKMMMPSSESVVEIYEQAAAIEGLIAL